MKKFIISLFLVLLLCSFYACGLDIDKNSENLNHYDVNLTYDETLHKLTGDMQVSYTNNSNTSLSDIKFNIYANAFRENSKQNVISLAKRVECYYNGPSWGNILIKKVYNENQLDFEICGVDENILSVKLENKLNPMQSVCFAMDFEINLPNISHRFGYGENTINFGNFLPTLCVLENGKFNEIVYESNGDPFFSETANYYVNFTYNNKFTLATSGIILDSSHSGDFRTDKIKALSVRDFAMVLSDKFSVVSEKLGKTNVMYYFYNDANHEGSLKTSVRALKTFNELFGEYPYETLSVVQSNFCIGGMEFPNLVLISDLITDPETYQMVIVHEIAHQWWYGLVGNNQTDHAWLDEGLAEFSTALFYKYNEEYSTTYDFLIKRAKSSISVYQTVYEDVLGEANTTMNRPLSEFRTENEYINTAYVKGLLLFDSLSDFLSEKVVIKCLKNYLTAYAFNISSPAHLIASFEATTSCHLESFFNSWMNDKVVFAK